MLENTRIKERPIIFSAPMVRAILAGQKTQTRRAIKPQPLNIVPFIGVDNRPTGEFGVCTTHHGVISKHIRCPYGELGDRLWVRETFADEGCRQDRSDCYYRADGEADLQGGRWTPSIFMPRWASRILLEVVSVRVERLQDISEADAKAEGIREVPDFPGMCHAGTGTGQCNFPRNAFADLWMTINGPDDWNANRWVWIIEFRRIEPLPIRPDLRGAI